MNVGRGRLLLQGQVLEGAAVHLQSAQQRKDAVQHAGGAAARNAAAAFARGDAVAFGVKRRVDLQADVRLAGGVGQLRAVQTLEAGGELRPGAGQDGVVPRRDADGQFFTGRAGDGRVGEPAFGKCHGV